MKLKEINNPFPQLATISTNTFVNEILSSLENKNYLSALCLSLMLPDICSKALGMRKKARIYKMV